MMKALHEVISKAGANMSEASRNAVLGLIDDDSNAITGNWSRSYHSNIMLMFLDNMAVTNARLLGVLIKNLPATTAVSVIKYVQRFHTWVS
jgi:hypothetical protein